MSRLLLTEAESGHHVSRSRFSSTVPNSRFTFTSHVHDSQFIFVFHVSKFNFNVLHSRFTFSFQRASFIPHYLAIGVGTWEGQRALSFYPRALRICGIDSREDALYNCVAYNS